MGNPIPRSQHRPIVCHLQAVVKPEKVQFKRRFNFKKANWKSFSERLDEEVRGFQPEPENYEGFVERVQRISRQTIPRGCRTSYIPGLDGSEREMLKQYQRMYEIDPFSEETVEAGEEIMEIISANRGERWTNLMENLDMRVNSRRAWRLLKNLSGDPTVPKDIQTKVTADQVATQLLLNGKTSGGKQRTQMKRDIQNENNFLDSPFSLIELQNAIKSLKSNRAAGIDGIRDEQIKHFGHGTLKWLLAMMNSCVNRLQVPKSWRKANICSLPKPGKDLNDPKSYRPVSLLCQIFKVFERMILNRIAGFLETKFIPEQAGFRPGKSCCGQVLNLTQHIEDGYERGQITGVCFVDLTAAYDTVNHRTLLNKVYDLTRDFKLTSVIGSLLQNRRFQVFLQGKKSRWRIQKNGLPQGSVLAPTLFNIYTNDQPVPSKTRSFIYADDTALAAQGSTFDVVENKLSSALEDLAEYYKSNHLKPNPTKTQTCVFHLRNREAKRRLNITWQGQKLQHCATPRYLGVILDRTLSYKEHCLTTGKKVAARNCIIRKLTGSTWGANPHTLRTSAIALSLSAAEYAAPVWSASAHTNKVDIAVNETARIITGCLKPTPVDKVYPLAGIAPPAIRRKVAGDVERSKQETDPRHPLYDHQIQAKRLKSRKSFMARTHSLQSTPTAARLELWKEKARVTVSEALPTGGNLTYSVWKSLNRLRVGVARCKSNMMKWGYLDENTDPNCRCGEIQDQKHLYCCPIMDQPCTHEDLILASDNAVAAAIFWKC